MVALLIHSHLHAQHVAKRKGECSSPKPLGTPPVWNLSPQESLSLNDMERPILGTITIILIKFTLRMLIICL